MRTAELPVLLPAEGQARAQAPEPVRVSVPVLPVLPVLV